MFQGPGFWGLGTGCFRTARMQISLSLPACRRRPDRYTRRRVGRVVGRRSGAPADDVSRVHVPAQRHTAWPGKHPGILPWHRQSVAQQITSHLESTRRPSSNLCPRRCEPPWDLPCSSCLPFALLAAVLAFICSLLVLVGPLALGL